MKKLFISAFLLACLSSYSQDKRDSLHLNKYHISEAKKTEVKAKITSLINDGYCKQWAIKKALVESKVIKADKEYFTIIND